MSRLLHHQREAGCRAVLTDLRLQDLHLRLQLSVHGTHPLVLEEGRGGKDTYRERGEERYHRTHRGGEGRERAELREREL